MKDPKQYRIDRPLPFSLMKAYEIPYNKKITLSVLSTEEPDGWNHISIALPGRDPTWMEMSFIKDLFFDKEEMCIQIHPKHSEYVNLHRHCLHIWQPPKEVAQHLIRESY